MEKTTKKQGLGIFPIENNKRKWDARFVVEIPMEKIQVFIAWLYVNKHILVSTSLEVAQRNYGSLEYFKIFFAPAFNITENEDFLKVFKEWCEENGLKMMNMEKDLQDVEKITGEKIL